jgi:hypothetical protein
MLSPPPDIIRLSGGYSRLDLHTAFKLLIHQFSVQVMRRFLVPGSPSAVITGVAPTFSGGI